MLSLQNRLILRLERENEKQGPPPPLSDESDKGGIWWVKQGRRLKLWEMISVLLQGLSCIPVALYKEYKQFSFSQAVWFRETCFVEFKNINITSYSAWSRQCAPDHICTTTGKAPWLKTV